MADQRVTSALDVAELIYRRGITNSWKVQKLLYYCQAWSLVWDDAPLFQEEIQAWRDGPVCPRARVGGVGDPNALSPVQLATVEAVLSFYGAKSPEWLVHLTHREAPWVDARGDVDEAARTDTLISTSAMRTFYKRFELPPKTFTSIFRNSLEILVATPKDVPSPEEDQMVDGEAYLRWLESGEGDPPWVKSVGSVA